MSRIPAPRTKLTVGFRPESLAEVRRTKDYVRTLFPSKNNVCMGEFGTTSKDELRVIPVWFVEEKRQKGDLGKGEGRWQKAEGK